MSNKRASCLHCGKVIERFYPTPGEQPYWEDGDGESACRINHLNTKFGSPHEPADEEY